VTDLRFDDPCILFALRRESSAFRREFRPQQSFPGAPCRARFCGPSWLTVLVLETGMGAASTEAAVQWLLSRPVLDNVPYRPKLVLSAGFAGALQDRFHVGDILLATEVTDSDGTCRPATWPGELPPGEWRPPLHRGRLLTLPRLVSDPQEKAALGQRHQAAAVDMESATAARLCHRQGVPFGSVRAVSDDVNAPLSPQLVALLEGGRVSWLHLLAALARSPRLGGELRRLAVHTRFAAKQLAAALGELLTLTLPGGAEL
jgi:adenosylhomocysteine nucleosidase